MKQVPWNLETSWTWTSARNWSISWFCATDLSSAPTGDPLWPPSCTWTGFINPKTGCSSKCVIFVMFHIRFKVKFAKVWFQITTLIDFQEKTRKVQPVYRLVLFTLDFLRRCFCLEAWCSWIFSLRRVVFKIWSRDLPWGSFLPVNLVRLHSVVKILRIFSTFEHNMKHLRLFRVKRGCCSSSSSWFWDRWPVLLLCNHFWYRSDLYDAGIQTPLSVLIFFDLVSSSPLANRFRFRSLKFVSLKLTKYLVYIQVETHHLSAVFCLCILEVSSAPKSTKAELISWSKPVFSRANLNINS